jgi:hypothetical protein
MLDEKYELGDTWYEDEDGCLVVTGDFGDGVTEVHHWIPDDFAPHIPDGQCGCHPVIRANPDGVRLFEHFDQDQDGEAFGPSGPT